MKGLGEVLQGVSQASKGYIIIRVWAMVSNLWASCPKEAQARLVPPKLSTKQGPAKTMNTPSKDLKSNAS
jgi:hypothetical protein